MGLQITEKAAILGAVFAAEFYLIELKGGVVAIIIYCHF